MDYAQIITSIGTVISTVYILKTTLGKKFEAIDKKFEAIDKRFDRIEEILWNQDQRISKLEGEVEGMRGMLQTIVGFLLGHKTGTDLK